jgi:hypothetical protein
MLHSDPAMPTVGEIARRLGQPIHRSHRLLVRRVQKEALP